jgi:hypothetical protein
MPTPSSVSNTDGKDLVHLCSTHSHYLSNTRVHLERCSASGSVCTDTAPTVWYVPAVTQGGRQQKGQSTLRKASGGFHKPVEIPVLSSLPFQTFFPVCVNSLPGGWEGASPLGGPRTSLTSLATLCFQQQDPEGCQETQRLQPANLLQERHGI